jgi:arsenical resistance protein ArsH
MRGSHFDPHGLPLPDDAPVSHPKVQELRDLSQWSEGQVWVSPERHGAMTGIMKAQIDWIPLSVGSVRPTQGKTLAVMEVSGGSQSFNALNQMRILSRWMRKITIPNQWSVAKAYLEFDADGRMKPSSYYDRVVDVCEELVKFTILTRDASAYLTDRNSERKEQQPNLRNACRCGQSERTVVATRLRFVAIAIATNAAMPIEPRAALKISDAAMPKCSIVAAKAKGAAAPAASLDAAILPVSAPYPSEPKR